MTPDSLIKFANDLDIPVSITDVKNLLLDRYRWPTRYNCGQTTVEVILGKDGSKLSDELFLRDGYLNSDLVLNYYERGYTVLLSRVQFVHPTIKKLHDFLYEYCNFEVNINMYMGTGVTSVSFPPHLHSYEVLVKSLEGASEWIIGEETLLVEGKQAVYFDAYVPHAVVKIIKPKLTLTCNLVRM